MTWAKSFNVLHSCRLPHCTYVPTIESMQWDKRVYQICKGKQVLFLMSHFKNMNYQDPRRIARGPNGDWKVPQHSSSRVEDRLLVLQPGIRALPLRWESQLQDTGPQETPQLHVISNGENLPEISISTPRPSFTKRSASYIAGRLMPNNQQDRKTTPSISTEAAENHNKATDTPKHTTRRAPAHQKDKIQPHPPEHRH